MSAKSGRRSSAPRDAKELPEMSRLDGARLRARSQLRSHRAAYLGGWRPRTERLARRREDPQQGKDSCYDLPLHDLRVPRILRRDVSTEFKREILISCVKFVQAYQIAAKWPAATSRSGASKLISFLSS